MTRRAALFALLPSAAIARTPEDEQFRDKWNQFAESMRELAREIDKGAAPLKLFRAAAKKWKDLYKHEGWLK